MEDLSLGRIAALIPEFEGERLALGQNTDDDISVSQTFLKEGITFIKPEQFRGPSYSCTLRKQIDQFYSIF